MEPTYAARKDCLPIKISRLWERSRFIATVIKNDRSAHTITLVAVNRCHVRTVYTVMFKLFIEGFYSHSSYSFRNKFADWVVYHSACNTRIHTEAISKICSNIELATAHMNFAFVCSSERNSSRIEPVNQSSE